MTARVLYLSSPIGLGHARRDIGIANALRDLVTDVRIDWLAQDPVTRLLVHHGETVHPASVELASESDHFLAEADDHRLHVNGAFQRAGDLLYANAEVLDRVLVEDTYDLVVADEAWEVQYFWHAEPRRKRAALAWMTDFVGVLPIPELGDVDAAEVRRANQDYFDQVEGTPWVRDAAMYLGTAGDVVDLEFGPGLPRIRDWVAERYDCVGWVPGFDKDALPSRDEVIHRYLLDANSEVVVAAVGGSGIGAGLLRVVCEAHRLLRRRRPSLVTIVVTGPRIDADSLPDAPGLRKLTFVPQLHELLATADCAVVQGGLSTTMELAYAGTPFVYVPLIDHFEQQFHVRHRLDHHGVGRAVDYRTMNAESLAADVESMITATPPSVDVSPEAARTVATRLAELCN